MKIFTELLSRDIHHLHSSFDDAIIIIAGDFNQLKLVFRKMTIAMLRWATAQCVHIIYKKIFVSRPDLYKCSTFHILITKHKAVLLAHPDSKLLSPL